MSKCSAWQWLALRLRLRNISLMKIKRRHVKRWKPCTFETKKHRPHLPVSQDAEIPDEYVKRTPRSYNTLLKERLVLRDSKKMVWKYGTRGTVVAMSTSLAVLVFFNPLIVGLVEKDIALRIKPC